MKIAGAKCFTNGRSSGQKGCPFNPKNAKAHILVPYDFEVAVLPTDSDAEISAAVIAAIQAAFVEDAYSDAAQFLGKYVNFEDKSEAAVIQKLNLQFSTKVQRTKYMMEYQHIKGQDYQNFIRTLEGKEDQYKVVILEDGTIVRGVNKYDTNGFLTAFKGVELDNINAYEMKEGTPAAITEHKFMLSYADAAELNEDAFVINTGVNMFDVCAAVEVTDLQVIPFTATSARVHPIMIKTEAGDINVADTLGSLLDDPTLILSAVNDSSGVAIAVTSVAVNIGTGKYVVTFTAGAGYVATQTATLTFATVSTLHGLGADYYRIRKRVQITMA